VEWFPVRSVSVAGSTGLAAHLLRAQGMRTDDTGREREITVRELSVSTFTSRLALHVYF